MNYYNDNDPKKAAWLRTNIEDGLIPQGVVDERSIAEIQPEDLEGFTQHHFFAGIGGWSLAFMLACIGDDQEAVSCSCPCQPWSQTGKGLGYADPRHLFPQFHRLVRAARFSRIFGEQVASKAGRVWVEGIRTEMENLGYTFEWVDLCAPGVSAPQLRQRIFWVAYRDEERAGQPRGTQRSRTSGLQPWPYLGGRSGALWLGDSDRAGSQGRNVGGDSADKWTPWSAGVAVCGRDGKMRRIEPGIFPLAHGIPDRVGLIGGAGDAIIPLLASEFIQACEEARRFDSIGI